MVQLSPEVISSLDGTLSVHTIVLGDRDPLPDTAVDVTVAYTDRNGTDHAIAPASGKTDKTGAFDAALTGLMWDGTGTVTATVAGGPTGTATFAVLDRTPPVLTITPPANNQVRMNTDVKISVHITDEIGTSQVFFEWSGNFNGQFNRDRSTIIASGSADTTLSFDWQVPDNIAGTTITLYALGEDLSGNQAAAQPVTVTVVP